MGKQFKKHFSKLSNSGVKLIYLYHYFKRGTQHVISSGFQPNVNNNLKVIYKLDSEEKKTVYS